VKRYEFTNRRAIEEGDQIMVEAAKGDWIRYEDAQTDIFFLERWRRESEKSHERKDTEIHNLNNALTAITLERDALKRELVVRRRCSYGGDYGVCELEAGHDGRHSLRSPSKSTVEGQS
jgi:hypothetical protein